MTLEPTCALRAIVGERVLAGARACVVMVTEAGLLLTRPSPTTRRKVSATGSGGAVNVGLTAVLLERDDARAARLGPLVGQRVSVRVGAARAIEVHG